MLAAAVAGGGVEEEEEGEEEELPFQRVYIVIVAVEDNGFNRRGGATFSASICDQ